MGSMLSVLSNERLVNYEYENKSRTLFDNERKRW